MKYILPVMRGVRSSAVTLRERLLAKDPHCAGCGLDLVEMNRRRHVLISAYESAMRSYHQQPLLPADRLHPVCLAIKRMGFIRYRPHEPLADVDHITPLWAGGSTEDSNCQILCQPCHNEKTGEEAGVRTRFRGRPWAR